MALDWAGHIAHCALPLLLFDSQASQAKAQSQTSLDKGGHLCHITLESLILLRTWFSVSETATENKAAAAAAAGL